MPSRREFIQSFMAASAWAACPLTTGWALADNDERLYPLFKLVFEQTSAEGAAFGAEGVARGAPAHGVGSEIGSVWMNEIEPRWKQGPAAIAGLTGGASLFCLELLARDYGMGVVYRAEHSRTTVGHVRHVITGSELLSTWQGRLAAAGPRWSAVAAAMAISCPAALRPDTSIGLVDLAPQSGAAQRSLFSWVIAPAKQAHALARYRS